MVTETAGETAAPPTTSSHASPDDPSPQRGNQLSGLAYWQALEFATLATMRERSTGAAQQYQQRRTESTRQGAGEEMT